jgi:tetratricopeptide (TPR) repeat protein
MLLATALVQLAFMQPTPGANADLVWLQGCIALVEIDPARAYEEGMAWSQENRRSEGWRCAAVALVDLGRPAEGARRLEALGSSPEHGSTGWRAEVLSQAGNAWLIAGNAPAARRALTDAITLMGDDATALPDLLIDRAQAHAMAENWRLAEEDLNRALDLRGEDALAHRLRAVARMNQNAFALAVADAERAVALAPQDIDALLVLGHTREAERLGQPVATAPAALQPDN